MAAIAEDYSAAERAVRFALLRALLIHAAVLGAGLIGLLLALRVGTTWGWVIVALALAAGVANAEHLARAERSLQRRRR
jgi:hypothetical protein